MKKTIYSLLFIILTVSLSVAVLLSFNITAENENVLFVSDEGIGNSPSSLEPAQTVFEWDENVNEKYHLNSALYQAAERLGETGGTLVICGPVTIGNAQAWGRGNTRDCFLPESDKELTITSVYNGTDYKTANGAYVLIDEGAHIVMGSPSVWKDIEIRTGNTNRAICCNGKKTVFDTGITCSNKDGNTDNIYYPSIVGGHRYETTNSSSDITVKSGTWNTVCGAIYGISTEPPKKNAPSPNTYSITFGYYYFVMNGDVNITITGGTVKRYVTGDAFDLYNSKGRNVYLNGDVNITMTGGSTPSVYGTARNCFLTPGNKVNVKISENASVTSSIRGFREDGNIFFSSRGEPQYGASSYTLDVSESNMSDSRLSSLINADANNFTKILYPDKWITNVTVKSLPAESVAFVGDLPSSEGAEVTVSYTDPVISGKVYTSDVKYGDKFTSECDTSSVGAATAQYFFAGKPYASKDVTVIQAPSVVLSGIQIKYGETPNTRIRIVGTINKKVTSGVVIDDYGVIAARKTFIPEGVSLTDGSFAGEEKYTLSNSNVSTYYDRIMTTSGIEIMPNEFKDEIVFVGFVTFTFGGKTYTRYSNELVRSPYGAAVKAAASGQETAEVREAVRSNVVTVSDTYSVLTAYNDASALRQEVVDYMKAMSDVEWTPQTSFKIDHNSSDDVNKTATVITAFSSGKTYRGIPYTNYNITQLESFSDMVSDGIMPVGSPITTELGKEFTLLPASDQKPAFDQKKDGLTNYYLFPGTDCSTAIFSSWNRVFNIRPDSGILSKSSRRMIPGFGSTIKVGEYDSEIDWDDENGTKTILNTEKNSARAIYNAYALLQKGDAVVHWDAEKGGHTRMISDFTSGTVTTSSGVTTTVTDGPVHIELASNGQIDGANSYVITIEQANSLYQNAGSTFADSTWRVYKKYTFLELWKDYYIPVTIPELATGNSSADSAYVYASGLDLENDLALGRITGRITSNRQIIGVRFTVKNSDGTTAAEETKYVESLLGIYTNDVPLHEYTMTVNAMLEGLASGEYTFSLTAIVNTHNSEIPLVSDYTFTK